MEILSKIVNIPKIQEPTSEYVESELKKLGIIPLRWAIVKISEDCFTVSCAYNDKK